MFVKSLGGAGLLAVLAGPVMAQEAQGSSIEFSLNTLFLTVCVILVMWMTAGFTMLEAGFVRSKNVVNQCAKNIGLFSISTLCFLALGYTLAFPDGSWWLPGVLASVGMTNITPVAAAGSDFGAQQSSFTINVLFQMMFAAAVASIVSGALAERMRLLPFFIFTAVLTGIIYPIQVSWTWGGGYLASTFGFVDLAGSTVVHVCGGVAALTGSVIIGARRGRFTPEGKQSMMGDNLPLASLGALILWMGWFGFNAGSYLNIGTEADASNVARILMNTTLAAAAGVVGAALVSYTRYYRFDLSFMINGALGGLVSITAEPLYPSPLLASAIGMTGGVIVVWAVVFLEKLKIDDVVGAVPVHLFCGAYGTVVVVLSHPTATLQGQMISLAVVAVAVGAMTSFVWQLLDLVFGLRVSKNSEDLGTDETEMLMVN